jgi:hypothetical protein
LRIILFQSLLHGLSVATEKREKERTKEKKQKKFPQFKKNLAAETKERTKDKKSEKKKVSIVHPRCHLKLWPIFVLRAVLNVL